MEFRMCILWEAVFEGSFCFIRFLPDFISKIASFTPTYWFVQKQSIDWEHPLGECGFHYEILVELLDIGLIYYCFLIIQFV